jgi:hypothetical protein
LEPGHHRRVVNRRDRTQTRRDHRDQQKPKNPWCGPKRSGKAAVTLGTPEAHRLRPQQCSKPRGQRTRRFSGLPRRPRRVVPDFPVDGFSIPARGAASIHRALDPEVPDACALEVPVHRG